MIRLFLRPKRESAYSIEKLFNALLPHLKEYCNIDVYTVKTPNKGFLSKLAILREVRQYNSSFINHITGDINFIALALNGKKTILTIHDVDSFVRKGLLRNLFIRLFWLYLPLRKVKVITVISDATKSRLLQEFTFLNTKDIHVIPNCLTNTVEESPKEFNKYEPVILQVGTKENKNLPNLIKAIGPIKCRLLIVGRIDKSIKKLLIKENVTYEVFENLTYNDINELYKRCDIVTLISKYEGFGLPIIEANAIGRVVITSNISSMPEVAGDAALLVDPHDIELIRKKIKLVIDNPSLRAKLISKGLENIKRFAPEVIAKRYIKLYEQILTSNET